MARPKKAPGDKRDLRVAFRLSAPDAEALGARAKAAGLSVGAYARMMALRGKVQVVTRPEPDFALLDQLRRIGVNLNQLAREQHRRGGHDPDYLRSLCEQIETMLSQAQEDRR
ncbi:plasmid mobilization protein [Salipiger thiooxidans]|uniref:plasmid mobilization protein n=1 Tax=Salipiger thiooxidans TaxID=282683 RepID=UPI001CFB61E6|nr:plasmid mobilization relaxosome protein MobC [Salipiger thiooxidans]